MTNWNFKGKREGQESQIYDNAFPYDYLMTYGGKIIENWNNRSKIISPFTLKNKNGSVLFLIAENEDYLLTENEDNLILEQNGVLSWNKQVKN